MDVYDLVFSGIDGATGRRLDDPTTTDELGDLILGGQFDGRLITELAHHGEPHFGVAEGAFPERLDDVGWAVVGSEDTPDEVIAALRPLLDLRRDQAGDRYHEFLGADGLRRRDRTRRFLQRHGVGLGMPVNPDRVPYYLLLVGGPGSIPFEHQYELAAGYAVGRLDFDRPADYQRYAERVLAAESARPTARPSIDLFGPSHPDDPATQLSAELLVDELHTLLESRLGEQSVSRLPSTSATKDALLDLLGECSDLLVAACHGLAFPPTDDLQLAQQGALLCQDWPGPAAWTGRLATEFFVSADDARKLPSIETKVMLASACFSAGTPQTDGFPRRRDERARVIAARPFVASLPKQLLAHPGGGALGFIGHVDRTWGSSFRMPDGQPQVDVYDSVARAVANGSRLGHASRYFALRHQAVGVALTTLLDEIRQNGLVADRAELSRLWLETNDARGVVVLGDPAVRVRPSSEAPEAKGA